VKWFPGYPASKGSVQSLLSLSRPAKMKCLSPAMKDLTGPSLGQTISKTKPASGMVEACWQLHHSTGSCWDSATTNFGHALAAGGSAGIDVLGGERNTTFSISQFRGGYPLVFGSLVVVGVGSDRESRSGRRYVHGSVGIRTTHSNSDARAKSGNVAASKVEVAGTEWVHMGAGRNGRESGDGTPLKIASKLVGMAAGASGASGASGARRAVGGHLQQDLGE
jgi:hypothetical protein